MVTNRRAIHSESDETLSPDGSAPSSKLPYVCENTYSQEICLDTSGGMPKLAEFE
jgi:hypothetical protein